MVSETTEQIKGCRWCGDTAPVLRAIEPHPVRGPSQLGSWVAECACGMLAMADTKEGTLSKWWMLHSNACSNYPGYSSIREHPPEGIGVSPSDSGNLPDSPSTSPILRVPQHAQNRAGALLCDILVHIREAQKATEAAIEELAEDGDYEAVRAEPHVEEVSDHLAVAERAATEARVELAEVMACTEHGREAIARCLLCAKPMCEFCECLAESPKDASLKVSLCTGCADRLVMMQEGRP